LEIPLNAIAFRGMVRARHDKNAAAQEFGFLKRLSAAAWTAIAMCTIPPATPEAAESPFIPMSRRERSPVEMDVIMCVSEIP